MKKQFFSLVLLLAFVTPFTAINASPHVSEEEAFDICAIYAEQAGQIAIESGSNYWAAVFHAYAYCDSVVHQ